MPCFEWTLSMARLIDASDQRAGYRGRLSTVEGAIGRTVQMLFWCQLAGQAGAHSVMMWSQRVPYCHVTMILAQMMTVACSCLMML